MLVATSVDAFMVVLRVNPKSRVELQRTKELLAEVHGNVIGTVVNASRLESSMVAEAMNTASDTAMARMVAGPMRTLATSHRGK